VRTLHLLGAILSRDFFDRKKDGGRESNTAENGSALRPSLNSLILEKGYGKKRAYTGSAAKDIR